MGIFKKIIHFLNPGAKIGALAVTDFDLKYALLGGRHITSASLRLPLGVVENGLIKNEKGLAEALVSLHSQISRIKIKKIPIILTIPDFNAYTQVFTLPFAASANLESAAKMNLQMLSPIEYTDAYASWQKVGESETQGDQLEVLAAFAQKQVIDAYTKAIESANFSIVAVEFPSIALARLVSPDTGQKQKPPLILIALSSNGLSFSVIRGKNVYFNYATLWQKPQMYLEEFDGVVIREVRKILNFYASHWQSSIYELAFLVPSPELGKRIKDVTKKNFNLEAKSFMSFLSPEVSRMNTSSLGQEWLPVLGSAMRGVMPRSEDEMISLASVSSRERFNREQVIYFMRLWRNSIFTAIAAVLFLFIAVNLFTTRIHTALIKDLNQIKAISPPSADILALGEEAKKFNDEVALVLYARNQSADPSPYLAKIHTLAGETIVIERIAMQSWETPVFINGHGLSEAVLLAFKESLASDPAFANVDLPLSSITRGAQGSVNFSISLLLQR